MRARLYVKLDAREVNQAGTKVFVIIVEAAECCSNDRRHEAGATDAAPAGRQRLIPHTSAFDGWGLWKPHRLIA